MGEPSHRQFLGAAAALAALPGTAEASLYEDAPDHPDEPFPEPPDDGYGYREIATNDGTMYAWLPDEASETTVAVGSYHESVTVTVSNRIISLTATLFPEDVDELRAELAAAKERLDVEEVEHYRELSQD